MSVTRTVARVRRRGLVLALMCVGMFLVLLDVTVVNVALPQLRVGLSIGLAGQQWVVDAYAIVLASLLMIGGSLGGRFGHRRTVLIGMGLFGAASLACGVAPGLGILIAGRVGQGVGAALLLPGTLAIIVHVYPSRAEQARAIGIWSGVSALALPAGPLIGGALVTGIGWRSVFLLNVPVVVLVGAAIARWVPDARDAAGGFGRARSAGDAGHPGAAGDAGTGGVVDVSGGVLAAAGLAGAVGTVILAGRDAPGLAVWCAAAVGALSLLGFLLREHRAAQPMLPLALLRAPRFIGPNLAAAAMNFVGIGTLFVATLYLQTVQGHSALQAGAMLLPLFVPLAALAPVTGRWVASRGPRMPMALGLLVGMVGCAALIGVAPGSGYLRLVPVLLGLGIGMGLLTPAVVAAAMRGAPEGRSGLASGVNNMARQAGGALGVAVYGAVAGSPLHDAEFVHGLWVLGVVGCLTWAAALAVTSGSVGRGAEG